MNELPAKISVPLGFFKWVFSAATSFWFNSGTLGIVTATKHIFNGVGSERAARRAYEASPAWQTWTHRNASGCSQDEMMTAICYALNRNVVWFGRKGLARGATRITARIDKFEIENGTLIMQTVDGPYRDTYLLEEELRSRIQKLQSLDDALEG